jgi:hypothetical protein
VTVNGRPATFSTTSNGSLLYGTVTFRKDPVLLELQLGPQAAKFAVEDPPPQSIYLPAK